MKELRLTALSSSQTAHFDPKTLLAQIREDLNAPVESLDDLVFTEADPVFREPYAIGSVAAAVIGGAGLAAADLWKLRTGRGQQVAVDVRAAAAAMRSSKYLKIAPHEDSVLIPEGQGSAQARGFHRTKDGRWIYLHLGFPHHQERIFGLLGVPDDNEAVSAATAKWNSFELEEAVFAAGACAGVVRTQDEWAAHPHGQAVGGAPLIEITRIGDTAPIPLPDGDRPLSGVRVLDLTWVLAGPTGTRTLAEHGADVLRIGTDLLRQLSDLQIVNTGFGKRSTVLNILAPEGRQALMNLVSGADVFVQGYRGGSFAGHGYTAEALATHRPGLIYVSHSAFGHLGPWANRRGYDTLLSSVGGIADEHAQNGVPRQLGSSPLDYGTGYLIALGAMTALRRRALEGGSYHVRVSLARTNRWFLSRPRVDSAAVAAAEEDFSTDEIAKYSMASESPWGTLVHLAPVAQLSETPAHWARPSVPLATHEPVWE